MSAHPFIEVTVDGDPVSDAFYDLLVTASIHDAPGHQADRCRLVFDDKNNQIAAPPEKSRIVVTFGYRDAAGRETGAKTGTFITEPPAFSGGERGEVMMIEGHSADLTSALKEPASEHWDDPTVAGVIGDLARRHGLEPVISPALADVSLGGYVYRLNQSAAGFGTDLARQLGALFAIKNGRMLLVTRGQAEEAGLTVPELVIDKSECSDWFLKVNPRARFGKAEAAWFDRGAADVSWEAAETGLDGPGYRLPHPMASRELAQRAAEAEAHRLNRGTVSGRILCEGRPEAAADARIRLTGFRPELSVVCASASVDHHYDDGGYRNEIALEAPSSGKPEAT